MSTTMYVFMEKLEKYYLDTGAMNKYVEDG